MLTEALNPSNYAVSPHSVGPWVVGGLIAILGIVALLRERGSKVSLAFFGLTMSVAIWLFSAGVLYSALDEPLALRWAKVEHLGVVVIPSLVLLFTLAIVQRVYEFRAIAWGSLALSGLFYCSILLSNHFITGVYHYAWGYYPRYGPLSLPFLLFFFTLLFGSLRLLQVDLSRSPRIIHQRRIKALLVALAVAYLGVVDYLPAYGMHVYPFGYVPVLGFVVLMFRAVWRYRLQEITPAFAAEQIIHTMADALLVLDSERIVRVANQAAAQLFGYAKMELVGKPVSTALGSLLEQEKIDVLEATGVMRAYETHYRNKEGKFLSLDITGSVTRDPTGQPSAFVFIARDITGRKQLEEQARQAQKLEALGKLAGEIANDFETIFTVISRFILLPLSGVDKNGRVLGKVEEIRKAADKGMELTRKLLAFSSSQRVKPTVLDLNALVTNLHGVLEWVLGKDIEQAAMLDPALGWVKVDLGQIEQVIIKLAANARDAMPRGGKITFETANVQVSSVSPHPFGLIGPGKYAMLAMSASGWVMDEEVRIHLFEPFFRAKEYGRTPGLELAMVYGIVKQSGGQIAVESQLGLGTTFRIYLPLVEHTMQTADSTVSPQHSAA
ncbi:MAG: PAS domain S-box protein [Nitrospirae bacterium]|nr:MAG: PAS domain S-box protein [Nitrospirota bacterium]